MKKPFQSRRRLLFCSVALVVRGFRGQQGSRELWLRTASFGGLLVGPGDPSTETEMEVEHECFVERDGSSCSVQRFLANRRGPFRSVIHSRLGFTCKSAGDSNLPWTQHVFTDTSREGYPPTSKWNWGENKQTAVTIIEIILFFCPDVLVWPVTMWGVCSDMNPTPESWHKVIGH